MEATSNLLSDTIPRNRKRKKFIKLLSLFFVVLTAITTLSITAFADDGVWHDGNIWEAEEQKWGWPLDGIYKSFIHAFQDGLDSIVKGAFTYIDEVTNKVKTHTAATPANFEETALNSPTPHKVFDFVETVAKNVMVPIGAVILSLLVMYDFILELIDKNNFHEFNTAIFFRFILKTVVGIWFLANVFDIVNGLFGFSTIIVNGIMDNYEDATNISDIYQGIHNIICGTSTDPEALDGIGLGTGILLFFPALLLYIVAWAMDICSYIILIGRMMEIYLYISVSPIPFAMITNREFGETGKNYIRTIFSFVLHGAFIMMCCSMYAVFASGVGTVIQNIVNSHSDSFATDLSGQLVVISAWGALMIFAMFKSSGVSKSIVGAH